MDKMFWLFSNIDIIFSLYIGIWSSSSWGQVRLASSEIIVEVVLQTLFKNKQISNDYEWINMFYRRSWRKPIDYMYSNFKCELSALMPRKPKKFLLTWSFSIFHVMQKR